MATLVLGPRRSGKTELARELAGVDYVMYSDDESERVWLPLSEEHLLDELEIHDKTPIIFDFDFIPNVEERHIMVETVVDEIKKNRRLIIFVSDNVFPSVLWDQVSDIYLLCPLWLVSLKSHNEQQQQQGRFLERLCLHLQVSESGLLDDVQDLAAKGVSMIKLERDSPASPVTMLRLKDRRGLWSRWLSEFRDESEARVARDDMLKLEQELERLGLRPEAVRFDLLKDILRQGSQSDVAQ